MNTERILSDIQTILTHFYVDPEFAVKRWANTECRDYQIPLALIIGFLSNCRRLPKHELPIRMVPEYAAAVAIVRASELRAVLEIDEAAKRVRYREEVPMEFKTMVADFIDANTPTIV